MQPSSDSSSQLQNSSPWPWAGGHQGSAACGFEAALWLLLGKQGQKQPHECFIWDSRHPLAVALGVIHQGNQSGLAVR